MKVLIVIALIVIFACAILELTHGGVSGIEAKGGFTEGFYTLGHILSVSVFIVAAVSYLIEV